MGPSPIETAQAVQDVNQTQKPLLTEGYVVNERGAKLTLQPVTLPPMAPTMVQVKILMSGLCHTDIHMRDNDTASSDYPLVLGHEGIGRVTHVGRSVRHLKVGDTVAISWIRDSCGTCPACCCGRENICEQGYQGLFLSSAAGIWGASPKQYNLHGGCFVRYQRIEEHFAIKISNGLPPDIACPLVCGGGTVFEPLCDYATPGSHVGIVGIGGLGTAAVKLARIRGCVVWALSGTASKKDGILGAGAHHFVHMKDEEDVKNAAGKLDLIIDTTPANMKVAPLLELLRMGGTLCKVGLPPSTDCTYSGDLGDLIFQQKKIAGSVVTGTRRFREMMQLVEANMKFMKDTEIWKTEHWRMTRVNEAMDEIENGTNRGYRFVLHWDE
ncbi:unnamed protein product [Agarophyton chilense]